MQTNFSVYKKMFFLLLFFAVIKSDAQNISTIAGNGTGGYAGDGAAATAAQIQEPRSVAIDASNNIYIADFLNHRIRKIDAVTGNISTVAGTGTAGYNGTGIAATTAQIKYPTSVTTDAAGNIYFADQYNNRIRKVTVSTGLISTVAGTGTRGFSGDGATATSAKLNIPYGVALDNSGNIYIADAGNNAIRKVTIATGNISTLAGSDTVPSFTGDGSAAFTARLNFPTGIAVDGSGNIYFSDYKNHRIRKITVATGIINTIGGTTTGGCSNMDGIAATSANLYYPNSVALDGSGNIYLADIANQRIRKITIASGLINNYAGNGAMGFSGDGSTATAASIYNAYGIALDAAGNVYIADSYNNRIRKVNYVIVPLRWINFTAQYQNNAIALQWQTANETNNVFFYVQYSTDGSSWENIGKLSAKNGNLNTYAFLHNRPVKGNNYYRIQQVDADGRATYSEIKLVKITGDVIYKTIVYPNPITGNSVTVDFGNAIPANTSYIVCDINGKRITAGSFSNYNSLQQISLPVLASGIYLLKLSNGEVIKLLK